jgi:hypothetical protein
VITTDIRQKELKPVQNRDSQQDSLPEKRILFIHYYIFFKPFRYCVSLDLHCLQMSNDA